QAAQWLETLKLGRAEDRSAFVVWCCESPVHIREFLEASWIDRELHRLDAAYDAGTEDLLRAITSNVRLFPQEGSAETSQPATARFATSQPVIPQPAVSRSAISRSAVSRFDTAQAAAWQASTI